MPKYKILEPFVLDDVEHTPAEEIELTEDKAAELGPKVELIVPPETPQA